MLPVLTQLKYLHLQYEHYEQQSNRNMLKLWCLV